MNRKALICLVFVFISVTSYSQGYADIHDFIQDGDKASYTQDVPFDSVESSTKTLSVYPIPVRDYLEISGDFIPISIRIFDPSGLLMYRSHHISEKINLANLKTGKYVLLAIDKDSKIKTMQILKL